MPFSPSHSMKHQYFLRRSSELRSHPRVEQKCFAKRNSTQYDIIRFPRNFQPFDKHFRENTEWLAKQRLRWKQYLWSHAQYLYTGSFLVATFVQTIVTLKVSHALTGQIHLVCQRISYTLSFYIPFFIRRRLTIDSRNLTFFFEIF